MWVNGCWQHTNPTMTTERSLAGANEGYCLVITDGEVQTSIKMFQHVERLYLLENIDA